MEVLMILFVLLPLAAFVVSMLVPQHHENAIAKLAIYSLSINLFIVHVFIGWWIWGGRPDLNIKELVLYKSGDYEFFIDFYFDKISAVYLWVGSLLTFMVSVYSRVYLHREEGYRRFFSTMLFFFTGFTVLVLAGNFETMFIGWEILGISSFLLIAFYRNRRLPVRNAIKVFSIYRIGDVGLILTMWLSHHLWHENITFSKLHNYDLVHHTLSEHSMLGVVISLMILLAAAAKSAQFPFSSWLPRAMEGPTPSSAIFYGSLSVHIGAFILLRTHPFWEHQISVRILFGLLGVVTSFVCSGIANVQPTAKSQIAYSSASQIGLIFLEIALGFEWLALIHFAGNAFLRTYQLLVSPSLVTYLINDQFYHFKPKKRERNWLVVNRIRYTWYMVNLNEWYLDSFMFHRLWNSLKWAGNKLIPTGAFEILAATSLAIIFGGALLFYPLKPGENLVEYMPVFFSVLGIVAVLKSLGERKNAALALLLITTNHLCTALAIMFNEQFNHVHNYLYLSGVLPGTFLGLGVLLWLKQKKASVNLRQFHGLSGKFPVASFLFLLACLSLAGFPITPSFIGEDIIYSHIHIDQKWLISLTAIAFVLDGIALIRLYARLFLGSNPNTAFGGSYRSA